MKNKKETTSGKIVFESGRVLLGKVGIISAGEADPCRAFWFECPASDPDELAAEIRELADAGELVEVFGGDVKMATGYVTKRTVEGTPQTGVVKLQGLSKTWSLVGEPIPLTTVSKIHFIDICRSICAELGVDVVDDVAGEIRKSIAPGSINPQQHALGFLLDLARGYGLSLKDDEEGRLVVSKAQD